MRPDFELFAAFLVDMGRTVHGETLDAGGERNGAPHLRAGALGRVDDFPCRIVENPVIEGFKPDADILTLHWSVPSIPGFELFQNLRDDARTHGASAFTDGEAQLLFHR